MFHIQLDAQRNEDFRYAFILPRVIEERRKGEQDESERLRRRAAQTLVDVIRAPKFSRTSLPQPSFHSPQTLGLDVHDITTSVSEQSALKIL